MPTSRPPVRTFFEGLGFDVDVIAVAPESARAEPELVERATVAVVDVALEPLAAVELIRELAGRRPSLPVSALVCCPHAVTPWGLRALLAAGVTSFLDLRARTDDLRRSVYGMARGDAVLNLQVGRGGRTLLRDVLTGPEQRSRAQLTLLELVARGLSDREIAGELYLSPHTVKHHIEHLRTAVGVRNRVELAAWAGRHGFYPGAEQRRAAGS